MGRHSFGWWRLVYAVSFFYASLPSVSEAMESAIDLLYVKYTSFNPVAALHFYVLIIM